MNMTQHYDEKIKAFRDYLRHVGYSKSSVRMLPECVKDFLEYNNIIEVKSVKGEHITVFHKWLKERPNKNKAGGLSEQYIHHHIYALKVFFSWLEQNGEITENPISVMKFKRPTPNHREPFTQAEINALFDACENLRETALLHLFYSCGLRRSEGIKLDIRDIHFKEQILYVREGKGVKRRAVPLPVKVSKALENYYLKERTVKNSKDHQAFMLNRLGLRMSGNTYNRELKEIASKAGINREISLHYLRHSIATHLLETGLSIEYVRDFLGHSHLETTQIYAKVNQRQIKKL